MKVKLPPDTALARQRHRRAPIVGLPLPVVVLTLLLSGCDGTQSALNPAGYESGRVLWLFVFMLGGACVIWLIVFGTASYAMRIHPRAHGERVAQHFILWGGVVFPTVVLAGLLVFGLALIPDLRAAGDGLRIAVSGEQWWWRVAYHPAGSDQPVTSANEVRLPVGERVEITLDSPDVIHSFWIPPLGGKVDMIPGRTTRLVLEPTRTGTFRGVCAEFCGESHALMAFPVVVMEPDAFEAWLQDQAAPAVTSNDDQANNEGRGRDLFLQAGCGACHSIRGTAAAGVIGPDLTHVGGRLSLGAGILPNDAPAFARFISEVGTIKPGARMPSFEMLPEEEITAIAGYLASLE